MITTIKIGSSIVTNVATLMGDVDNAGGCTCVGTGSIWEVSIFLAQFCCGPKTALRK